MIEERLRLVHMTATSWSYFFEGVDLLIVWILEYLGEAFHHLSHL